MEKHIKTNKQDQAVVSKSNFKKDILTWRKAGIESLLGIQVETVLKLRQAYEKLRQLYFSDAQVGEFSGYEVLILLLADKPKSAKTFSEELACKPAQITGYVSRLESLGFLKRKISQSDRRSFTFQLTRLGRQKADDLLNITRECFESNTKLTEKENRELVRLLSLV